MKEHKLGTEVLRERLGEIESLITQVRGKRVTLAKAANGVIGGYSIVELQNGGDICPQAHKEILDGGFIGETFKRYQVPVHRQVSNAFVYRLPSPLQAIFNHPQKESFVKQVQIKVGHVQLPYASIIEVYCHLLILKRYLKKKIALHNKQ